MSEKQQGMLNAMSPQQTFAFGLVGGILVLCTIGFFILLGVMLSDSSDKQVKGYTDRIAVNDAAATDTAVNPTATQISVAAVDPDVDHIRGNADAPVTIIEFSDPECPYCKRFHETMQQIVATYGDDVRWIYRNFPLDTLHSQARTEAIAMECAGQQGKFWEYTDMVYARTTSNDGLDLNLLPEFAKELGLNVSKFNTCLNNKETANKIMADEQDAQRAGGRGTPYSVLVGPNGETEAISGAYPFANVEQMIQKYLN